MNLGKFGNTELKISSSYWFLIAFILFIYIRFYDSLVVALIQSITTICLLTFILGCHEMGHIKAAEKTGMSKESTLTLWALGGVATIPGLKNATPKQELLTALAGPAVNLVFALLSIPIMVILGMSYNDVFFLIYDPNQPYSYFFMTYFFVLNILTGVFNMLPGFPMDGGRTLRSSLAIFMPHLKATTIAVYVAWVVGGLMLIGGLWFRLLMLPLIGGFVLLGSWSELRKERTKAIGFEVVEDDELL